MSRPLRVAYLSRYLPSPSETFVLDEARAVAAAGATVLSVTIDRVHKAARHARFEPLYAATTVIPRPSAPGALYASLVLDGDPLLPPLRAHWGRVARSRDLRRALWLARWLRAMGADALRVHLAAEAARYGAVAAQLARIPLSIAVHGRDLFVPVDDFSWILSQASQVTTITPLHRERLLRSGLPSEQVSLLPCAVDLPERSARPPQGPLRVLAVGRLIPKKGHDLLIEACATLARSTPVTLVIVGGGGEGLTLTRLAAERVAEHPALQVELLGEQPSEVVQELMLEGGFHLCALACRVAADGDRDGLPVSLLEAQGCGLPIVTTALPGFEFAFSEGQGARLVPLASGSRRERDGADPSLPALVAALAGFAEPSEQRAQAEAARAAALGRPGPAEVGARLVAMLTRLLPGV